MKMIQTIADIKELKAMNSIPLGYLKVIENELINWFEAEGECELLTSFRLPSYSCIYHLEDDKDGNFIEDQIINIEFIEKEVTSDCSYYRIGMMNDHQMSLFFFVEGTLSFKNEQWLLRLGGDNHV
ncbi:hypothetical protein [Metabacillus sp. B2-18]|uniref:hypothetical protein n=1 Tax=Metabacillus sp. B2-18 TaxID=2897333 RepID=UPI001E2E6521|nr:hypothetical protein [Metabacillus sp. B2-18]UGB30587.1 hypothetical protein LPC09_23305 [Metabacillus sp. B2-18]